MQIELKRRGEPVGSVVYDPALRFYRTKIRGLSRFDCNTVGAVLAALRNLGLHVPHEDVQMMYQHEQSRQANMQHLENKKGGQLKREHKRQKQLEVLRLQAEQLGYALVRRQ